MTIEDQIAKLLKRKAQALVKRSKEELSEIIDDGFIYPKSES